MATEVFLFGDFHPLPVEVGPYTLLDRVGAGGMAEVFLAELKGPEGFAKSLVLKRLLPEHKGVPELEKMFLREARLAALLDHPGLMQTYELADVEGELFMVMENVAGLDLSRLARAAKASETRIPFDVLAAAIADVALGLHHMHTLVAADGTVSTVIHRDVSPDNIVLAHTGAAKLIDFGVAKSVRAEQLTTVGELKGKLRFMPPEQLRGQKLGPPADMFSLGVTLYRLLTGKHPFAGTGQLDVVEKILSKRPRPPRAIDADVPDDLAELAMALVEKDANDRPRADEVYGRIIERWPRDLRASAAFVARMRPGKSSSSPALVAPATVAANTGAPGSTTADERFDDESEVPTSARGAVASAYREILSMRDDAVIAVAPEGTRIVTIAARADVHDRDTRVVDVTNTRTATRAARAGAAASANAARAPTVKRIEPFAPTQPPERRRAQSSRAPIIVAVLGLAALGALVTAALVQTAATTATSENRDVVAARPPPSAVPPPPPAAPVADVVPAETAPVASAPAESTVVDSTRPIDARDQRADARHKRSVRVELRAPPTVEWRNGSASVGKGNALATLSADARDVVAIDARNGGRVRVPIVDGVADFARVERGTLHVLVHPFGKVWIGPKSLGESPIAPLQLPIGRYHVRVAIDETPLERDVDVTAGTQQVKFLLE